MQSVYLKLVVFVSCAATALAINCYSCESTYEQNCGEVFEVENYWKLDCSRVAPPRFLLKDLTIKNATACMKKIYLLNDQRRVMRSCFYGDINDTSVGCRTDPALTGVTDIDCLVCNDVNYCNAAHRAWPGQTPLTMWPALWTSVGVLILMAHLNH